MSLDHINSILLHPVVYYILQNTVSILIVGFTSPNSYLRNAALPPMLLCSWLLMPMYLEKMGTTLGAAFLATGVTSNVLAYIDTALYRKWSFEAGSPSVQLIPEHKFREKQQNNRILSRANGGSVVERIRFGYFAVYSSRYCGSPFEVPNVPPFDYNNPAYVPSRGRLLLDKAKLFIVCYLVVDLAEVTSQPGQNQVLFAPHRIPLFSTPNLSYEHLIFRTISTPGIWTVNYIIIQLMQTASALVRVGTGVDHPKVWRPVFGPLSETYTLRGFWSHFWHQLIRLKLVLFPDMIVYQFLRFPKGRLLTRYLHLLLVFLASGLFHLFVDIVQGIPFVESGSIQFFCLQGLGIIFEDSIQALYRSLNHMKRDAARPPTLIARLVGHAWVLAFLVWSTPIWLYPAVYRNRGEEKDGVLPFSVIKYLST